VFPTVVRVPAESEVGEWSPFGAPRFADQLHPGLTGQVIALAGVAADAGTHHIFPGRLATPVAWKHMVEIEIFAVENPAAILAGVPVALEHIVPRELYFFFRIPVEKQQHDHAGDADAEADGMHHLGFGLAGGQFMPTLEIMGIEAVLGAADHLSMTLIKQGERPADRTQIHRLPEAVEHEHLSVEHALHPHCAIAAGSGKRAVKSCAEASIPFFVCQYPRAFPERSRYNASNVRFF